MNMYLKWLGPIPLLLAACNMAPTPVTREDRASIQQGVNSFLEALHSGDEAQLAHATIVQSDPASQKLATAVLRDTATSRHLHTGLAARFDIPDDIASTSPVGSDDWIDQFASTASIAPMLQAGDRVRIGNENWPGVIFLRLCDGRWQVELVPTLVIESGGRRVSDRAVLYRYGVTAALNQWMLARLAHDEFRSYRDYQNARHEFWEKYLALVIENQDPRNTLLSTLPPIPVESNEIVSGD